MGLGLALTVLSMVLWANMSSRLVCIVCVCVSEPLRDPPHHMIVSAFSHDCLA